jgi:hypothetical protein
MDSLPTALPIEVTRSVDFNTYSTAFVCSLFPATHKDKTSIERSNLIPDIPLRTEHPSNRETDAQRSREPRKVDSSTTDGQLNKRIGGPNLVDEEIEIAEFTV